MFYPELKSALEEERLVLARAKERSTTREMEMEKKLAEEKRSMLTNSQQLIQQNSALQERIKVCHRLCRSLLDVVYFSIVHHCSLRYL